MAVVSERWALLARPLTRARARDSAAFATYSRAPAHTQALADEIVRPSRGRACRENPVVILNHV